MKVLNKNKEIAKKKEITTAEFDKKFNKGEDIGDFLDVKKAKINK